MPSDDNKNNPQQHRRQNVRVSSPSVCVLFDATAAGRANGATAAPTPPPALSPRPIGYTPPPTSPLCNSYCGEQQQDQQQQQKQCTSAAEMAVLSAPPSSRGVGAAPSLFARRRVPAPPLCFAPLRDSSASFCSPCGVGAFGLCSPRSPALSIATTIGNNLSFLEKSSRRWGRQNDWRIGTCSGNEAKGN
ncbi:hypothetical protein niasHS_006846 [Heterodera schachtii]|uniref:Uncharacterized protein n=1 Tax=Heterodera schachtii TaxID=97005 RepID=A0ABD2JIE4_HETSC